MVIERCRALRVTRVHQLHHFLCGHSQSQHSTSLPAGMQSDVITDAGQCDQHGQKIKMNQWNIKSNNPLVMNECESSKHWTSWNDNPPWTRDPLISSAYKDSEGAFSVCLRCKYRCWVTLQGQTATHKDQGAKKPPHRYLTDDAGLQKIPSCTAPATHWVQWEKTRILP